MEKSGFSQYRTCLRFRSRLLEFLWDLQYISYSISNVGLVPLETSYEVFIILIFLWLFKPVFLFLPSALSHILLQLYYSPFPYHHSPYPHPGVFRSISPGPHFSHFYRGVTWSAYWSTRHLLSSAKILEKLTILTCFPLPGVAENPLAQHFLFFCFFGVMFLIWLQYFIASLISVWVMQLICWISMANYES